MSLIGPESINHRGPRSQKAFGFPSPMTPLPPNDALSHTIQLPPKLSLRSV